MQLEWHFLSILAKYSSDKISQNLSWRRHLCKKTLNNILCVSLKQRFLLLMNRYHKQMLADSNWALLLQQNECYNWKMIHFGWTVNTDTDTVDPVFEFRPDKVLKHIYENRIVLYWWNTNNLVVEWSAFSPSTQTIRVGSRPSIVQKLLEKSQYWGV